MIILASQSKIRRTLLAAAGITFTAAASPVDEVALQSRLQHLSPRDLAVALAEAKAAALDTQNSGDFIIGVDQVCAVDHKVFHKPKSMDEAKQQLWNLNAKTHQLHTAYAIYRNGENIAQHCETASLRMRQMTEGFVEDYIATTPQDVLMSVGCYQLEGRGIQLMQEISGDYFGILGLPLLPLLGHLRELGEIPK